MATIVTFQPTNNVSYQQDETYARTYTREFVCVVDTPGVSPDWIRLNISTILGNSYVNGDGYTDPEAIVNSCEIRNDPNDTYGRVFRVVVNYGPWDPYRHASSPLLLMPIVTVEGINYSAIAEVDSAGNPVVNRATDFYDPQPEIDWVRCTIRVQQNLATFSPATVLFYANKINSDTWFGCAPHTVKIDPPRGTVAYHQTCGNYWAVEWSFNVSPNLVYDLGSSSYVVTGWDKYIQNRGYRQLVDGAAVKIVNSDGSDIDQAAFLDADGLYLPPPVDASDIIYDTFQVYPDIDFSSTFASFPDTIFF